MMGTSSVDSRLLQSQLEAWKCWVSFSVDLQSLLGSMLLTTTFDYEKQTSILVMAAALGLELTGVHRILSAS